MSAVADDSDVGFCKKCRRDPAVHFFHGIRLCTDCYIAMAPAPDRNEQARLAQDFHMTHGMQLENFLLGDGRRTLPERIERLNRWCQKNEAMTAVQRSDLMRQMLVLIHDLDTDRKRLQRTVATWG